MQIYCWDWCQTTITPLHVSVDTDRSSYALGSQSKNQNISYLVIPRPIAMKIWSYLIFNGRDQNAKLRASSLQPDRRKMLVSVLMDFILIAALCSKQWDAFTNFVPVKWYVHLSLKEISNAAVERECAMHSDEVIYKRNGSMSLKMSVNSRDYTRQAFLSKNISQKNFLTDVEL